MPSPSPQLFTANIWGSSSYLPLHYLLHLQFPEFINYSSKMNPEAIQRSFRSDHLPAKPSVSPPSNSFSAGPIISALQSNDLFPKKT